MRTCSGSHPPLLARTLNIQAAGLPPIHAPLRFSSYIGFGKRPDVFPSLVSQVMRRGEPKYESCRVPSPRGGCARVVPEESH